MLWEIICWESLYSFIPVFPWREKGHTSNLLSNLDYVHLGLSFLNLPNRDILETIFLWRSSAVEDAVVITVLSSFPGTNLLTCAGHLPLLLTSRGLCSPALPLTPPDLLSCTKEIKTVIRKWVLLSHFWQLAGKHLRSPVTFYFCPSSLWLVAPRTCILLSNISYQRHSSRLFLTETAVTGWCWLLSDSQTSQETEQDLRYYCWADLDSSADCLDSSKTHPLFQSDPGAWLTRP